MHCELLVQSHSLELPCYVFILEQFLIYLPLICVAFFIENSSKLMSLIYMSLWIYEVY